MKMLAAAGFLAIAITSYVLVGPEEGMLSGPGTISLVLNSFPMINF